MNNQTILKKIIYFPVAKIVIGILVVGGSVALGELLRNFLLDKTQLTDEIKNAIVAVFEISAALLSYILLFSVYEKRQISELSLATFWKNAMLGFFAGLILQSLFILIIFLNGGYSVISINSFSFLFPGFIRALIAGFVAEILILGIFFRLTEEKLGTVIALIICTLLFVVMHSGVEGATLLSVSSTAIGAGILLSAAYVFARSLWLPVFLHFAWDFAEPAIYGGINPGISIEQSLFTSKITGSELLTGGQFGPQSSIQAVIFCLVAGALFLWLAKQKNNFIKPYWKK